MKVVTHNGVFHADEVFAIAALKEKHGRHLNLITDVVRTRGQQIIDEATYAVDVGGVDDPSNGWFDHHQPQGAGCRENGIPYASFGLVWKEHGAEIAGSEPAAQHVDERLVQGIDAQDCGIDLCGGFVRPMTISHVISQYNPPWLVEQPNYDQAFQGALGLAQVVLRKAILEAQADGVATTIVAQAVDKSDKLILELGRFCPWQQAVEDLCPTAVYVIFQDVGSGSWRIQAVPVQPGSMISKKALPVYWRGLSGDELDSAVGFDGCVFCHRNGFIAGHLTREGALAMAESALLA